MIHIIYLTIGVVVGYYIGVHKAERGVVSAEARQKVMALFGSKNEIMNDDVQRALGVSDATATRILDSIEKSGEIEQIGSTGSGVIYRKK